MAPLSGGRPVAPTARLRAEADGVTIVLAGDWIAQTGALPGFARSALDGNGSPASLGFDTSGLGRWDSGLIAYLWEVKREAARRALPLDPQALPGSARQLLQLLPQAAHLSAPARSSGLAAAARRCSPQPAGRASWSAHSPAACCLPCSAGSSSAGVTSSTICVTPGPRRC